MSEPRESTRLLSAEMQVVAAEVCRTIKAGQRAGLTNDAAVLAALIGVISVIRVDMMNEESIFREARHACAVRHQVEIITGKVES